MPEVTNWNRFSEQPQVIVQKKRNYKPIIALIGLILGTLLVSVGVLLIFNLPAMIVALGIIFFIIGLALSF